MKLLLRHKPRQNLRSMKEIMYLCDKDELDCNNCPYCENMKCHLNRDALDYLLSYEDMERQISDTYCWQYKCTNCGREVSSSFDFCPKCGHKLNWEQTK